MDRKFIGGVFYLLGSIVGAGVFALPAISSKIGFVQTIIFIIFGLFVNLYLSINYLKVFVSTNTKRFEEIGLKLGGKKLFYFTHFLKILFVSIIPWIYVIGISNMITDVLNNIFKISISLFYVKIGVIILLFLLILQRRSIFFKIMSETSFILVVLMIFLSIFLLAQPAEKFAIPLFSAILLPMSLKYIGPFVFASMDMTITPQVYKMIGYNYKKMIKILMTTAILLFFLYSFFITSFLLAFNGNIDQIAVLSLSNINKHVYILGCVVLFFAMVTSAISFIYLLKDTLVDLYKMSSLKSTIFVSIPMIFSIFMPKSFEYIVETVGTLSVIIIALLISMFATIVEIKEMKLSKKQLAINIATRTFIILTLIYSFAISI